MSGAPALEASTPAFAHTNPCRVRQMRRPRSARTSSADSSSTTCTCARVLAVLGREPARLGAGHDVGQARRRGPRPWRRPCGRRRARRRAAGRRRAGRPRRPAGRRGRRRGAPRARPAARRARSRAGGHQPIEHRAGACGAARRARLERLRAARRGRRACRRRGRATAGRTTLTAAPAARGARGVAGERSRPERRRDRVRWRQQQRVRAAAVAVGDDHHRGAVAALPSSASTARRASSAGQSPGTSSTRSAPRSSARVDPARGRGGLARLVGVLDDERSAARRRRAPRRLGGHDHDVVDRRHGAERLEHVGDHRLAASSRARRRRPASPRRCFARGEALDRQDGDGAHARQLPSASARGEAQRLARPRGAPAASRISTSVDQRRQPTSARSSATRPSSRPS